MCGADVDIIFGSLIFYVMIVHYTTHVCYMCIGAGHTWMHTDMYYHYHLHLWYAFVDHSHNIHTKSRMLLHLEMYMVCSDHPCMYRVRVVHRKWWIWRKRIPSSTCLGSSWPNCTTAVLIYLPPLASLPYTLLFSSPSSPLCFVWSCDVFFCFVVSCPYLLSFHLVYFYLILSYLILSGLVLYFSSLFLLLSVSVCDEDMSFHVY